MIVVDASVLVEFSLDWPDAVRFIEEAIRDDGSDLLHVPDLVRLESVQASKLLARSRQITDDDAEAAIERIASGRLVEYASVPLSVPLIDRIWDLRHNLTAYDASYVALAETLERPLLLTGDGGLAEQARRFLGADHVRHLK